MKKIISVMILSLLVFACTDVSLKKFKPIVVTGGGTMVSVDELFIPDPETGVITFETNNEEYWGSKGYSLWSLRDEGAVDLTSRTVDVAKISGSSSAGYGLVYCHTTAAGGDTMLVILINTQQQYIIAEVIGTEFTPYVNWTNSVHLNRGYNQPNRLTLAYNAGEFVFSINGEEETTFRDVDVPLHTNGRMGYMVIISPLDDFSQETVKVKFEE